MPIRNKILIVVGGVMVLTIFFIFVIYPIITETEPVQPIETTPIEQIAPNDLTPKLPDATNENSDFILDLNTNTELTMSEASQRSEVERITRLFVERLGSYSSFSDYSNVSGMAEFMTDSMMSYLNSTVNQDNQDRSGYIGVTTRIVRLQTTSFNSEQSATVSITVKEDRQEGLNEEIQTILKDGTVNLVYRGGRWLINGLFYE